MSVVQPSSSLSRYIAYLLTGMSTDMPIVIHALFLFQHVYRHAFLFYM